VTVGVTVGASVAGGAAVADGDWVKIELGDMAGVTVGVEEDSRVAQADNSKAIIRNIMRAVQNFFI